jgi:DNA end-binding protein Ku
MYRSMWMGMLNFGLVSMPVKLYSATSSKTVHFNHLHVSDHARVYTKRFCLADDQEVAYDEVVRGYEIAPDRYVVVEDDELAAIAPEFTRTIEIEDFVELSEIDPLYFDHAYYLVAGTGGLKPYTLLLNAMRETQKIAVARVVLRSREQLVCIRPLERVLAMTTMNFADEVLDAGQLDEVPEESAEPVARELDVARRLIDSLSVPFEADKYRDTYREAMLELIERKAEGKEIAHAPAPAAPKPQTPDLMSALKESLEEVRSRKGPASAARSKRTRAPAGASGTPGKRSAKPKPKSSARTGSGGSSRRS